MDRRAGRRSIASTDDIATELAVHFKQGHDIPPGRQYLQQAGENGGVFCSSGSHQPSQQGAVAHDLAQDAPERIQQELTLRAAPGRLLMATEGGLRPRGRNCVHARVDIWCQQAAETRQLFPVLWGCARSRRLRGRDTAARELGNSCRLAQRSTRSAAGEAHNLLGSALTPRGSLSPPSAL